MVYLRDARFLIRGHQALLGILLLDLIGQFVKYDSPVKTVSLRSYPKAKARTHLAAVRGVSHGALGLRAIKLRDLAGQVGFGARVSGLDFQRFGPKEAPTTHLRKRRARGFEIETDNPTLSFSRVACLIPPT